MLDRLLLQIEVTDNNEDCVWFACKELEKPLLQRLKRFPLPFVAVEVDVEGIYLELLLHNLH
jgi:hypothetical protein